VNLGPQPRILLVKLSSLGDVIHALPTLEALRAAFPQAHITWLVEAPYAPLLAGHPALNEVWPAPKVRPANHWALARLARLVRSRSFDLVLDIQGLAKSALWVWLARSPRKVGYDATREWSYKVLTERVPPYNPNEHAVLRYLNLARHLGATPTLPFFRFGFGTEEENPWPELAEETRPLAVLHPGTRWPTKMWPPARFAQLADWLTRHQGCRVVLTGGAADRGLLDEIEKTATETVLNLGGRTTLAQLARLFRQATLAVTTDTGPMHLAAALGTPVAALFGPTAPWRTGPFGEGHQVVRLGLECSPCFKRRCPEPRCLTDLPLEAAQAACEKILSRSRIS
jgi:heptosyltransferase-1